MRCHARVNFSGWIDMYSDYDAESFTEALQDFIEKSRPTRFSSWNSNERVPLGQLELKTEIEELI